MYRFIKPVYVCLCLLVISLASNAQEIKAKVTVNASRVNTTVDRKVFITLQNQLTNFINNRKWTSDAFKANEKIECGFLLNIESIVETNVYKASLIIQAARPVYGSAYQSALVNFQDAEITFKYIEFQPIEFNENRIQGADPLIGNLSACFAFYVYTILGLDYDSFAPKGGDKYFQKAQNIVNNAPEAGNITGWKLFDGLRNRYWLNENLINNRYNIFHDVVYAYFRSGLDRMAQNETEARTNIVQALQQLHAFNKEYPNTFIVQFFLQNRELEWIGLFKKAPSDVKQKVVELLVAVDINNAQRYKDELK